MRMGIWSISILLALSLCGCTASDKTQINHLEKDTAGGLKALGKETEKAGDAITNSVSEAEKGKNKAEKDPKTGDSKPGNDFEQNARKTMTSLGKEADKADRAIVSAVKDAGKKTADAGKDQKGRHD
jgi:hypothetical protein